MTEHTLRHQLKESESELAGAKSALAKAVGAHEAEVRALNARIAVLEEALRPFAFSTGFEDVLWGHLPDSELGTISTKLGDFRRARAAFSDKSPIRLVGNWTEKL